jgi:hypothetical protein
MNQSCGSDRHAWVWRDGRSECLACGATADDGRGMPPGSYPVRVGGRVEALTPGRLREHACPICLENVNPRMMDGELRVLCAGPDAHDVAAIRRALTRAHRDAIVARREMDVLEVIDGLPAELRAALQT